MTIRIVIRDINYQKTRTLVLTEGTSHSLLPGENYVAAFYIDDGAGAPPSDSDRLSAVEDALVDITRDIAQLKAVIQLSDHDRLAISSAEHLNDITQDLYNLHNTHHAKLKDHNEKFNEQDVTINRLARNLNDVTNYLRTAPRIDPL